MRIAVIHGQVDQEKTYQATRLFMDALTTEETVLKEYFMSEDGPEFCTICRTCFLEGNKECRDADAVRPIVEEIEAADLIILSSSTVDMGMTKAMKAFLDHMSYRWISHRPHAEMFKKTGLVISTSKESGWRQVCRDLARNLLYMGVPRVYHFGRNLNYPSWDEVPFRKKEKLRRRARMIAESIQHNIGIEEAGLKSYLLFTYMKYRQRKNNWNPLDKAHWKQNGWLSGRDPWAHRYR